MSARALAEDAIVITDEGEILMGLDSEKHPGAPCVLVARPEDDAARGRVALGTLRALTPIVAEAMRRERAALATTFRARAEADRRAGSLETAGVWEAAARVCEEESE